MSIQKDDNKAKLISDNQDLKRKAASAEKEREKAEREA